MVNPEKKEFDNYYKILDISPMADLQEIMEAYNQTYRKIYFETVNLGVVKTNLKEEVELYTRAFNTLISPELRKEYDQKLQQYESSILNELSQTLQRSKVKLVARDREVNFKKIKELTNQAKFLIENHEYDEAIKVLQELISLDRKNAHSHSLLGLALLKRGWEGYAMAEFKIALHYDTFNALALKYYRQYTLNQEPEKKSLLTKLSVICNRFLGRKLQKA
jgi:hypothetical protein